MQSAIGIWHWFDISHVSVFTVKPGLLGALDEEAIVFLLDAVESDLALGSGDGALRDVELGVHARLCVVEVTHCRVEF